MSDTEKQADAPKSSEIDIIAQYNDFVQKIPWNDLKKLPEKLGKYAKFIGLEDASALDISKPLNDVITFIGVLVKRIRSVEKKADRFEKRLADLEAKAK